MRSKSAKLEDYLTKLHLVFLSGSKKIDVGGAIAEIHATIDEGVDPNSRFNPPEEMRNNVGGQCLIGGTPLHFLFNVDEDVLPRDKQIILAKILIDRGADKTLTIDPKLQNIHNCSYKGIQNPLTPIEIWGNNIHYRQKNLDEIKADSRQASMFGSRLLAKQQELNVEKEIYCEARDELETYVPVPSRSDPKSCAT